MLKFCISKTYLTFILQGILDDQFGFITANPSVPISIEKLNSNTGIHYIHLKAGTAKILLNCSDSECNSRALVSSQFQTPSPKKPQSSPNQGKFS